MITDLDVWAGECPKCGVVEFNQLCENCGSRINKLSVNVPEVLKTMEKNANNLNKIIESSITKIDTERECRCHNSLRNALL
jgi:purine nucleoside phosphorylase